MLNELACNLALLNAIVGGYVLDLGNDSFQRREAATEALRQIGPAALPLLSVVQHDEDLERARRSGRLIVEYTRTNAERLSKHLLPTNYDKLPWIDTLPSKNWDNNINEKYCYINRFLQPARGDLAEQGVKLGDSEGYPEYRLATQYMMRELLATGSTVDEVVTLITEMAGNEIKFIERTAEYNRQRAQEP